MVRRRGGEEERGRGGEGERGRGGRGGEGERGRGGEGEMGRWGERGREGRYLTMYLFLAIKREKMASEGRCSEKKKKKKE